MIGLILRARDNHHVDVYTVHEGPNPPADRIGRAEQLAFVRDGFTWSAAILPPVHFANGGEWVALGAYAGAVAGICGLLSVFGVSSDGITLAVFALHIYIGFEASTLRRAYLNWQGWKEVGTVSGRNRSDCERRFFESWLPNQPALATSRYLPDGTVSRSEATAGRLGNQSLLSHRGWRSLFMTGN